MTARGAMSPPGGKYSGILLRFAEPLLSLVPPGSPRKVHLDALRIAVTVWNAVVIDEARGTDTVEKVRLLMETMPEPGRALFAAAVDELIDRKRELFPGENWGIGRCELRGPPEDMRVRVEARGPLTGFAGGH